MVRKLYLAMAMVLAYVTQVNSSESDNKVDAATPVPCMCGIFLSDQFKKKSKGQPTGQPVILQEYDRVYGSGAVGMRQCTNKCLEMIVKHLPNSSALICASIDRDCHKERAYLFVKNGRDAWHNSNLSTGREYCCKDNEPYKCPS